jgi:hypothetical protein
VELVDDGGETVYRTKGDANEEADQKVIPKTKVVGSVFLGVPKIGYAVESAKTPQGFILLVVVPATIIVYEELRSIGRELRKLWAKLRGTKVSPVVAPALIPAKESNLNGMTQPMKIEKPTPIITVHIPELPFQAPLPPESSELWELFSPIEASLDTGEGGMDTLNAQEDSLLGVSKPAQWQHREKVPFWRRLAVVPAFGALTVFLGLSGAYFSDQENSIGNVLGAASDFDSPIPDTALTLVINEVLPDASCSRGNTEAQWLEVFNGYDVPVNLKNFQLTNGVEMIDLVTANNIEVPAGGLALLAHNSAIWNACYADNGVVTANLGGQLDIDVGTLQLLDANDFVIDTVEWGDGEVHDPQVDQSIEREPLGKDTAVGVFYEASDFVLRTTPRPGE